MGRILDQLAWSMLDATLAAVAVSGLVALVIVQSRQPARRRVWARAGLLATLTLIPIAAIHPVARLELSTPIRRMLPVTQDVNASSDQPDARPEPRRRPRQSGRSEPSRGDISSSRWRAWPGRSWASGDRGFSAGEPFSHPLTHARFTTRSRFATGAGPA
jgi:hypothetical protein